MTSRHGYFLGKRALSGEFMMPPKLSKLGLGLLAAVAIATAGCGGDAGVGDGRIQGTVLAPRPGFGQPAPASGVSVTAKRFESPSVIRTAQTNSFGNYQIDDLPTGTYELTFTGSGLRQDPFSDPVTVFVEGSRVATAPDVILGTSLTSGSSIVLLSVVDSVTGEPVNDATVTVGTASSSSGSNGTYTLFVPVNPGGFGQPASERILVNSPSHLQGTEQPSTVIPVPNQTVSVTVRVEPAQSVVQGVLSASQFNDFYRLQGAFDEVSITSDTIDQSFLNPVIDGTTGAFSVRVPGSSSSFSRRFNLTFSGQGFFIKVLSSLIAPPAGSTSSLSSNVVLDPATIIVDGNVVTSSGSLPAGQFDQVTVVELGVASALVSGVFQFTRIPTGYPLTLRATATNPFRPGGPTETGTVLFTAADNGTGRFFIGAIQTR